MVDFSIRWEVVNRMPLARAHGHGAVTRYLASLGVARSSAYRWEQQLRWLAQFGPKRLRELANERDALHAQLHKLLEGKRCAEGMSRVQERRFILFMAVLGNSDAEIATLLEAVGGRGLSHETIRGIINKAAELARAAFAQYFRGVGTVAAVDEIFLGKKPLLLAVEPTSLLISALRLAETRSAEEWRPVFEALGDLEGCLADGGRSIGKAAAEAGVPLQRDMWHLLRSPRGVVDGMWGHCEQLLEAETAARQAYEAVRHRETKKVTNAALQRYCCARRALDEALAECVRLHDLLKRVEQAFDYTTPDGKPNTARRADGMVADVFKALEEPGPGKPSGPTPEAKRLAKKLRTVVRARPFGYLDALNAGLSAVCLDEVGAARDKALGRLVIETLAWRDVHKKRLVAQELEAASEGTVADEAEVGVLKAVDAARRSSSYVECVNARIRTVQVARKRVSEDFVYLLAVYHNMKPFGRGSVREGRTPAQLAGIALPTEDWIELLDLMQAAGSDERAAQAA